MKTEVMTQADSLSQRQWYLIDADGLVLGRLATQVARILRGKHKPTYAPNQDTGDFVVIVNAARVALTGDKASGKVYYRHSGYPGSIRSQTAADRLARAPELLVRDAVRGMLPKNRLGRRLATKLKVYAGQEHPHEAQQPSKWNL